MRSTVVAAICLIVMGFGVFAVPADAKVPRHASESGSGDETDLGPEITEYLTFLDAEVAELTHLYEVGEVPASDFHFSRNRLAVTRDATIRIAVRRKDDRVPDLYVLTDAELTQILPAGAAALRGKRTGDRVGEDFVYHGRIRRGAFFNVLERTGGIGRARPY